ncbi:MAG: hypothetical protein AAFN74_00530 [Myxococcota bacterium]
MMLLAAVVLVGVATPSAAQTRGQSRDQRALDREADVDDVDEEVEERKLVRRSAPSNLYVDPASFFRLHGYATLSYSSTGDDLGGVPFRTPHILVSGLSPRTGENEGGFLNDAALFVGAEPFDGVSATIEVHFVGNGLNPVLTEAKATWDFLTLEDTDVLALRIVGGRYWWPFGNHNGEWFSAVNRFSLVSVAAAEVVPAHFNEVGLMAEGEISLTRTVGINATLSVGNGVPSFELPDVIQQTPFDYDGDPTLTGRVALFVVASDVNFEAGFSLARGQLREGMDASFVETDPRRFGADFSALGADVSLTYAGFDLSGYYYASTENLDEAIVNSLSRRGVTVEAGYRFDIGNKFLRGLGFAGRVSYANEETLDSGDQAWLQYGGALYADITRAFTLRASYLIQEESREAAEADNNVLTVSMTAEF